MNYLQRRDDRKHVWSDEEILTLLARKRGISEYQYFHECARQWHFSKQKAEADFNTYLKEGLLPYYVRDTVRKQKEQVKAQTDPPLSSGGSLPPSWSA
jgi:hypothetical protein